MHDAILVGIGTALNDDPQLNTRHVPALPSGTPYRYHLPRPIILDRYLRLSHNCKLLNNYRDGKGRRPWIFSSVPSQEELTAWNVRRTALEIAGAKVYITAAHGGLISLPDVLLALKNLHIRSLMVEGGANVIQSFLKETLPDPQGKVNPIVDTVIVTVAPTLVGPQGIAYDCNLPVKLNHIRTAVFGRDAVMALKFANI
ncbi:hypothetical protein BDW22DRAFT_1350342 [Trametopsis cervina]|nr:hypothetical protein BDW22DRAFT_1350342 [Trametopsis cervina]